MLLCSQQRRKVTVSLARQVRERYGDVGKALVGYLGSCLVYVIEAIGVFNLLDNRHPKPKEPITTVVANEVHERTMFKQIIGNTVCLSRAIA